MRVCEGGDRGRNICKDGGMVLFSLSTIPSLFPQRMEGLLSKFQSDLGSISSEIQYLQDQSHSMSIKLKNRQVQLISGCVNGKFMLWIMQCFTLQSMGHKNHKFPM